MEERKEEMRRRGEVLEEAILRTAWEELAEKDYVHPTMESVVTRAGTNKAVLYRRWDNRSELVIAALCKHLSKITSEVLSTGSLRGDVYAFLHARVEPMRTINMQAIRGLMMDPRVWCTIASFMPYIFQKGSENKLTAAMMTIIKNVEFRGEISLGKLLPRIIILPLDLLQCELITKQESVSDIVIMEVVDDIFMSLIHASQQQQGINRG